MIGRILVLSGGIVGAASFSQFPEFSQQYTQRLAGKVEELTLFVENFDADAIRLGLTRDQALSDLAKGGAMGTARAKTMQATIARRDHLTNALGRLRDADTFTRVQYISDFADSDLIKGTWRDYQPALPLTLAGAIFAATGFAIGALIISLLRFILRLPFSGRKRRLTQHVPGSV